MAATANHASARHMEPGTNALRAAAETALTAQGVQWTDLRELVFSVLAETGEPSSAYAIAERVSTAAGRRIAANSVYRILDLFVANNLVRRVESANAFVANSHPGCLHDCIFLICDSCGTAVHVDNDKLSDGVRAAAEATGFAAERPVIEVRGKCAECQ